MIINVFLVQLQNVLNYAVILFIRTINIHLIISYMISAIQINS